MGMKTMIVLCLVFIGAVFVGKSSAELSCQERITKMLACQVFLRGEGPATPDYGCCKASEAIMNDTIDMPEKRRAVCQCLKGTRMFRNVNPGRVSVLPDTCRFSGTFPLAPDCNSV